MDELTLLASTGNKKADDVLRGIILLAETFFPERLRSCYVTGSYADGSAVSTSDLDLKLIFKEEIPLEERLKIRAFQEACWLVGAVDPDLGVVGEESLFREGNISLKLASLWVYGEDLRDRIPLPPLDVYARRSMHNPLLFFARVRNSPEFLTYPLDYPDPDGEFYGYDQRKMIAADGSEQDGVKEIVVSTGWAAQALLAYQAGQYVAKKSDCLKLYQEHIHDEWTLWLEEIYYKCRNQWDYLIPNDPQNRRELREICARAPAFENHFLALYKEFLLSELENPDEERRLQAVEQLGRIVFPNAAVAEALRRLTNTGNEKIDHALAKTLTRYS